MVIQNLCLSFLQITSVTQLNHPEEAQRLIKNRIAHQWTQKQSKYSLEFDNPNCELQGSYSYNEREIVMLADHAIWRGRLELNLTDVIEGRSLPLERVIPHTFNVSPKPQNTLAIHRNHETKSDSKKFKNWIPWTLAITGILVGGYLIHQREQHIRELNGLKVNF